MKNDLFQIAGWVMIKSARLVFRLPGPVLNGLFTLSERASSLLGADHPATTTAREVKQVVRSDPKGTRIIRGFFLGSRDRQAAALFGGMLKHHVLVPGHPYALPLTPAVAPAHRGTGFRIGMLGAGGDFPELRAAYEKRPEAPGRVTQLDIGDRASVLQELDGLEVATLEPPAFQFLEEAASRGLALSVSHSAIDSPDVLKRLLEIRDRHDVPLRVRYPYAYYPPVEKIRALLEQGEIGEVATVRVRATVGALSADQSEHQPPETGYLYHPAFDHFLLLVLFGGPLERTAAYLNPMKPERGGQGLVSCKHTEPGRCSLLECSYAPQLKFLPRHLADLPQHLADRTQHLADRTRHLPFNLEAEIAGSDGIIWLQRGMASRTKAAPIAVRVGQKAYTIGVESGFPSAWHFTYRCLADDMARMVSGRGRARLVFSDAGLLSAFAARDAAERSSEKGAVSILRG